MQPLFFRKAAAFIKALYTVYVDLYFTYLEINPLVITDDKIYILDLAAKLDATAEFVCKTKWGEVTYPPPFGRDALAEEAYIADLDAKSGASLKVNGFYLVVANLIRIRHRNREVKLLYKAVLYIYDF